MDAGSAAVVGRTQNEIAVGCARRRRDAEVMEQGHGACMQPAAAARELTSACSGVGAAAAAGGRSYRRAALHRIREGSKQAVTSASRRELSVVCLLPRPLTAA